MAWHRSSSLRERGAACSGWDARRWCVLGSWNEGPSWDWAWWHLDGWGAGRPRRKEGEWGEGPSLPITTMFCSEFANVFRLSVSMRKVAGQHPFCALIYMNSYIIHIYFILFILFILLSYPIFDFVCLTLSLADTHGIAKYVCTYIQKYTNTRTHTNKKHQKKREKKEDVTTISKPQSLTSMKIKDCTLRVLNKTATLVLYE